MQLLMYQADKLLTTITALGIYRNLLGFSEGSRVQKNVDFLKSMFRVCTIA